MGGGAGGPRRRGTRISLTGLLLVLGIGWFLGIDPISLLGALSGGGPQTADVRNGPMGPGPSPSTGSPQEEQMIEFVSFVLDDAQSVWSRKVEGYPDAKLVVYRDGTRTGCGFGQAAMGPFYCPADQKVSIDLAFYEELRRRFGAPGDMAQAYVLAHEIGHHVQKVTGTEGRMREAQRRDPDQANEYSIRLELQADCYAGVWAHSTQQRDILEAGDLEEAMRAAAAVGDDQIQKKSTGRVVPEQWTHGSSEMRTSWFRRGFESGDPADCDTFAG
jgi:predicted metalloprotease